MWEIQFPGLEQAQQCCGGKTVVKGSVVLRSEASPNKNLEKPSRQLFTCTCKTKTKY